MIRTVGRPVGIAHLEVNKDGEDYYLGLIKEKLGSSYWILFVYVYFGFQLNIPRSETSGWTIKADLITFYLFLGTFSFT